jgi:hypothetical protein
LRPASNRRLSWRDDHDGRRSSGKRVASLAFVPVQPRLPSSAPGAICFALCVLCGVFRPQSAKQRKAKRKASQSNSKQKGEKAVKAATRGHD